MRVLQADEVVTAVACWPKHHPVAGFPEGFNRLCQQTGWQGRAIAIDEQDTVMSSIQQSTRRAKQHVPQIIASLQQQSKPCRKQPPQDVFGTRRRIDAVAASAERLRDGLDRCGDVAQKAGRELRRGNSANGGRKPRL